MAHASPWFIQLSTIVHTHVNIAYKLCENSFIDLSFQSPPVYIEIYPKNKNSLFMCCDQEVSGFSCIPCPHKDYKQVNIGYRCGNYVVESSNKMVYTYAFWDHPSHFTEQIIFTPKRAFPRKQNKYQITSSCSLDQTKPETLAWSISPTTDPLL